MASDWVTGWFKILVDIQALIGHTNQLLVYFWYLKKIWLDFSKKELDVRLPGSMFNADAENGYFNLKNEYVYWMMSFDTHA